MFRGQRDYLHGASTFDFIVTEFARKLGEPAQIDFILLHKTTHYCRVESAKGSSAGLVASYTDENGQYFLYETDDPITERVAYSEPVEGEHFVIKGERVSIMTADNTFIELAVAAYKGLLTVLFPETKGRHILSRIQLERIPASPFEIHYKRKIAKRFYEGEIRVGGDAVGLIYFGV
ncbi:MAG: hypothetical protein DIZ79_09725 [endosymbiont of Lamellibrachia luymesi]|uniref:Uncharacterized protein n=1 Tax=endosymbiont of Lamellibrachia luymesi TaxID=2200907 RepID=A0A370DWF4_9GAMM|nr:MAG: hypothetical protein DIZ79_09725 [endosymbiont of Lamellibrachia luymesi]